MCLGKELQGELCEDLQIPKISVAEDRLNTIGFLGFWPNTISYGDRFIFVLICEFKAKGKVFTFCDHVPYCDSKNVRKMCSIGDYCSQHVH